MPTFSGSKIEMLRDESREIITSGKQSKLKEFDNFLSSITQSKQEFTPMQSYRVAPQHMKQYPSIDSLFAPVTLPKGVP